MTLRTILTILVVLVCSISYGQVVNLDSLEQFIERSYYQDLNDKRSLLSTDYRHKHYGLNSLVDFIALENICNNLEDRDSSFLNCKRLSLFNQTHLNYCEGIENFKALEYLNLSYVQTEIWGNYIREIPVGVYELISLKILVADRTNLESISYKIRNLKNLEYLSLADGKIRSIPKEIGTLKNLIGLDLSDNQIELLPDQIGNLTNLKYLNLEGNNLKYSIANELKNLLNLEFLSITLSDEYYGLEETIAILSELPNLKVLHIRYSGLKKLPQSFANFKALSQLSLRGNWNLDLAQSFELIGQIQTLKTLDLSFSRIKILPKEVYHLESIENFYLGNWKICCPIIDFFGPTPYNNVDRLPKTIKQMKSLKNLYLWTWGISDKQKKKMKEIIPIVNIEFESERPKIDLNDLNEE